jgi:hypothetical protein
MVQVLDTYMNMGPIVDMCLVDVDRQVGGSPGHARKGQKRH